MTTGQDALQRLLLVFLTLAWFTTPGFSKPRQCGENDHSALAAKTGEHIVLGTREGLRDFAQQVGGNHLLDNPAWKDALQKALADPNTKFSFKLDRLAGATPKEQVLNSIKASQEGWGGFTDSELHQLQQSGRLGEVSFFQGGNAVPNPFR